jgi:outer membrane protein OmpA-like peptidoglycan-associated protein
MRGLSALIQLIDLQTEEVVMELLSGTPQGEYLVSLPMDRDYALNVSAEGYLFYSDHFTFSGIFSSQDPLRRDIPLNRVKEGSKVVLQNIFFQTDSYELLSASEVELNKLFHFMQSYPSLRVEIGGHTDTTGSSAYNQQLSEQRARAVVEYLTGRGIGADRLVPVGYGDQFPVDDNDTEEGRANNRRTEFKIIAVSGL